jgi:hypothetical protein
VRSCIYRTLSRSLFTVAAVLLSGALWVGTVSRARADAAPVEVIICGGPGGCATCAPGPTGSCDNGAGWKNGSCRNSTTGACTGCFCGYHLVLVFWCGCFAFP